MLISCQGEQMEERVGYVIKKVQAALRARMSKALEAHGITMPQYAALSALERDPGISNSELARRSFVTPQTMIRVVANLEAQGLVIREPHPTHGRILQTELTEEGKKLVAACHQDALAVDDQMVSSFTSEEQAQLLEFLRRCARSLSE